MESILDALILDLLDWIGPQPRPYSDVMEAWRTSCPRLPVWEEANERGLIERSHEPGREAIVSVTALGTAFLDSHRRRTSRPAFESGKILGSLKRMLANGPLAHLPAREEDLDILLALAITRFAAGERYREADVNDILRAWLETFCSSGGVDHVTVRRCLVDAGYLRRDTAGSTYAVRHERLGAIAADDARDIEPAKVLAEIRREREGRKRSHPA